MSEPNNPPVVVVGLDCMTGLQTARILASHQIPVIGVAQNTSHPCCQTRSCKQVLSGNTGTDELLDVLNRMAAPFDTKLVLLPCTDLSVLVISRNRETLNQKYFFRLPDASTVEMLVDKFHFYRYAEREGLPIPNTFFIQTRRDLEEAIPALTFPSIVKPHLKTAEWERHTRKKAYKVSNADELLELYDRYAPYVNGLVVQEWIGGGDGDLYTCNCYFDLDSQPLACVVSRKLRQWPPEIGTGCLAEECRNDLVRDQTVSFFHKVGLRGFGYLEMKRDQRTGQYVITEPNIGRPTGRSAIAERAGVDFLYAAYCDMLGRALPANLQQKYKGVKWIYLRRDLQSAFYYWKRGELSVRDWWRSWRGKKSDALFSWTDPMPFILDLQRAASRLLTR